MISLHTNNIKKEISHCRSNGLTFFRIRADATTMPVPHHHPPTHSTVILNTVKDLRLPLQVSKRRYFRMTDGPTETPVRYHHPLPSTHSSVILNAVKDLRLFHPSIQENDLRHPLPNARIKNLHPNLQIITLRSRTMNSSTKTQTEKPA